MRISDWSSDVCSSDLVTGNAVIVKPSPEGAAVALEIAKLFEQAGLPAGLFQVVLGGADEALSLAAHQDVAVVTLTGGPAAGEALAREAGAKRFLGELGGHSIFAELAHDSREGSRLALDIGGATHGRTSGGKQ